MPLLTPNAVHIDQPLTNLSIAYLQDQTNFIADKVFPNVSVNRKTDKYYIYDRENFLRDDVKILAPGTAPERVGMALSTDSYSCDVRGLAHAFDFDTLANADEPLTLRRAASEMLLMKQLINRERNWMTNYFATGVWDTEYTGVTNANNDTALEVTQWDDYTNSTPIVDVTTAMRAMHLASGGFRPNVMVVTRDVRDVLVNHPDILDRLNGGATVTNTALVTDAKLAEIFGVESFLIVDAVYNTAKDGATESLSFVATKKAALYYRPRSAGLMVPSAGYNFVWDELDQSSGYGVTIYRFDNEELRRQRIAEEIQTVLAYDLKVVGSELGVFFNTIIS